MRAPREHEIETYTGTFVNVACPHSSTICIDDIAHGLAQTCRYGGQSTEYYSVAEHAVFVSRHLEEQGAPLYIQLAGLHHDDAEAYLGDIPRPIKKLLDPQYSELTEKMNVAVTRALAWTPAPLQFMWGVQAYELPEVKAADNFALFTEARAGLVPSRGEGWAGQANNWDLEVEAVEREQDLPEYWHGGLPWQVAEVQYIMRHWHLVAERKKELVPLEWRDRCNRERRSWAYEHRAI